LWCRGIRGAITVSENSRESIIAASKELLQKMVELNGVEVADVACVWFTTTQDLNEAFPAAAARDMGWNNTALLCGHEMNVPNSLSNCVRVMMLVNTDKGSKDIKHVYLKGAKTLRPDLVLDYIDKKSNDYNAN